jgi:hypothetical protein
MLEDRCRKVEKETDELQRVFQKAILDIKTKFDIKTNLLDKRITNSTSKLDEQQTQFDQVLSKVRLDPTTVASVTAKLRDVIESKNKTIKDLHYQVEHYVKIYNDTIRIYEKKLLELGIPASELGFETLPVNKNNVDDVKEENVGNNNSS